MKGLTLSSHRYYSILKKDCNLTVREEGRYSAMGKLFCIMGKSSSGKDTVYKELFKKHSKELSRIVPYTTRPRRFGETEGIEYFFVDEGRLLELLDADKVIEVRAYHTVDGIWKYFTADDGQIDLNRRNYLMITTLDAYAKIREYYGASQALPVYIEVEDGLRLERALLRERMQPEPNYAELCRRFLADAEDFSEEKLMAAGIKKRFCNNSLKQVCEETAAYIRSFL